MWRALSAVERRHLLLPLRRDVGRRARRVLPRGTASARSTPAPPTRTSSPTQGGQIRYARDRWLFRRGLDARRRHRGAERARSAPPAARTYGRDAAGDPELLRAAQERPRGARSDRVLWVGTDARRTSAPSCCSSSRARLPQRRFVMIGGPGAERARFYESMRSRAAATAQPRVQGLPAARARSSRGSTARACWSTPRASRACPTCSCRPGRAACRPWRRVDVGARRTQPVFALDDLDALARAVEDCFENAPTGRRQALPRVLRAHAFPRPRCWRATTSLFDELAA